MVRIKFTGPPSAVRSQYPQACADLTSDGTPPASSPATKTPVATNGHSESDMERTQLLQQQQSLEMVKIMLHVSFGTLFYLREFLPLPCFDDRDLKEAQRRQKFSYREFLDNKSNPELSNGNSDVAFGKGKRGQPLKVIIRGSDPKADLIIDVLETGIFDALSKSVLEAVQLTILLDRNTPDNVLESYTFSFKYTGGVGDLHSRLKSLSIEPCGYTADMKSAQTARVGLETIVRRLITLSAFLPTLPSKRSLGIHLFYTEDCPPDYEPPGFTGARDGTINYPLTENWRRETQTCGKMESSWHTVGLKVTSLKWIGPEPQASESVPEVPAQLEYNDAVPRTQDIGFENGESRSQTPQSGGSQEATQDAIERERLRMMMPSQEVSSLDSDLVPTQLAKPISASGPQNAEPPSTSQKLILPRRKIAEIRKTLELRESEAPKDAELPKPGTVSCECDRDVEEEAMVECNFCYTRQHLLCYGYEGVDKLNMPDVHACYQCLLGTDENDLFFQMKELALTRRVLRVILEEGYQNYISQFAEKLHCPGTAIARITDSLREMGILQPTPGHKMKGFMKRGLPRYRINESEEIHEKIQKDIMDPMAKIKHHYTEQRVPDSLETLSPPATNEADDLSKPNSQDKIVPASTNETDQQGTPAPKDKPTPAETPMQTRSSRRRTVESNIEDSRRVTRSTPQHLQQNNKSTPRPTLNTPQNMNKSATPQPSRKRTRASQVGPEPRPITPSQSTTDREKESDGARRSGRKRRKISNYSKVIDVGEQTSSDEKT
ncbi:HORMA domain-containing protein [Aspergillus egyptiacus]|nr:HORMA domain-containing protein [Aspergillus egyptiacus]